MFHNNAYTSPPSWSGTLNQVEQKMFSDAETEVMLIAAGKITNGQFFWRSTGTWASLKADTEQLKAINSFQKTEQEVKK